VVTARLAALAIALIAAPAAGQTAAELVAVDGYNVEVMAALWRGGAGHLERHGFDRRDSPAVEEVNNPAVVLMVERVLPGGTVRGRHTVMAACQPPALNDNVLRDCPYVLIRTRSDPETLN
jgi:hypothetical protein